MKIKNIKYVRNNYGARDGRVVFVGGEGSRGTSPSLDLTFPPTGLSENLGGMESGRGGKGEREGWGGGAHLPYFPLTGFCLKYHPGYKCKNMIMWAELLWCSRLVTHSCAAGTG